MAIPKAEQRILDFENMGFGMFIHYGLYSWLGRGEWVQHIDKIPNKVQRICWTDNGKEFLFKQQDGELIVDSNGYSYGTDLVVRIAEAKLA